MLGSSWVARTHSEYKGFSFSEKQKHFLLFPHLKYIFLDCLLLLLLFFNSPPYYQFWKGGLHPKFMFKTSWVLIFNFDIAFQIHMPIKVLFKQLKCTKEGLTSEDAANRLQIFGPNKLKQKKVFHLHSCTHLLR